MADVTAPTTDSPWCPFARNGAMRAERIPMSFPVVGECQGIVHPSERFLSGQVRHASDTGQVPS